MPKNRNTFSFLARWPRRAASRAVHAGWA
ncbi:acyltransferase, partial [Streptomyces parvus]|nr:acyltransferase [Streptomyces parvus]